ncbi:hypothetical protein [Pelagimonas varians]|uniref:Uncharacterized protein n=1 Tax=Pelagimonas varians TaxID=696760 RepID=A0A238K3N8_9RHOB|nr:hypothetical protein [Pelagimonas varians]PYG30475.1 hypothetical protein C8N36_106183 [Pelagimonas varians]SMX37509.1 hypothetical protein PEV8663_01107 [Pelagimonas varians]
MDPVSIGFYASVCGLLGLVGPKLGTAPIRLGIGAGVGVLAVALLPHLKVMLGVAESYSAVSP